MGNGKRRYTTRDKASPQTHTTAKIIVKGKVGRSTFVLHQADVEVVGLGAAGKGQTNKDGVFRLKMFRAGEYDVRVEKSTFGPPKPSGQVVFPGPHTKKIKFLPNTKLPSGVNTNVVEIIIELENPRIHIKVFEEKISGAVPLAGADIEIIGLDTDKSDSKGEYSSPHAPFKGWKVKVGKAGLVPLNQHGSVFFREVELRPNGFGKGRDRDLFLEVTLGDPASRNIPGKPNVHVSIWASGSATPHTVLDDPRHPSDSPQGQAGWDMGINFSSLSRLANLLSRARGSHLGGADIPDHGVSKLAIVAHGAPGIVDVDQTEGGGQAFGVPSPAAGRCLTAARISSYNREIRQIEDALRENAVVILASCQAAQGSAGEELLKALSRRWKTVTVVGVRSLATVVGGQSPSGSSGKMLGGVRDTAYSNGARAPGQVRDYEKPAFINDLGKLPWLSESSPHATVARDGNIIRRGNPA